MPTLITVQIKTQLKSSALKTDVRTQTIKSTVSILEYGVVNGDGHLPVDPAIQGSRFRPVLSGAVTTDSPFFCKQQCELWLLIHLRDMLTLEN